MAAGAEHVLVCVTACQTDGGESEVIETTYPGKAYRKDGCDYIFYDEYDPEDGAVTKASLRIRPGQVEMSKKGNISTTMMFIPGKCVGAEYRTACGAFDLVIDTRSAEVIRGDGELTVKLDYRLALGNTSGSVRNRLTVKIKKTDSDESLRKS